MWTVLTADSHSTLEMCHFGQALVIDLNFASFLHLFTIVNGNCSKSSRETETTEINQSLEMKSPALLNLMSESHADLSEGMQSALQQKIVNPQPVSLHTVPVLRLSGCLTAFTANESGKGMERQLKGK